MQASNRAEHASVLRSLIVVFCFGAGIALGGCASTMNLPSHWNEHKIVVDGKNNDWDVTYLIDDNKLVIGFVNDSSFVYLLLATNDRPLAMSLMRGITLWFDPQGGKEKTFGIRYPLGRMFARGARPGEGQESEAPPPDERLGSGLTELEILGPGKDDRHRMQVMETGGIQARANLSGNSFVYEIRVPYSDAFPFSIKTNAGSFIGLGLETSQARLQRRGQAGGGEVGEGGGMEGVGEGGGREGGGESGFGRGGMRSGGRGGRGGFGQGSSEAQEQLNIWMKVHLIASRESQMTPVNNNNQ